MPRGCDGYEIDDSRGSGFGSGRDVDRGSSSPVDPRWALRLPMRKRRKLIGSTGSSKRGDRERPPLARQTRQSVSHNGKAL
jgi:hypothetical protein